MASPEPHAANTVNPRQRSVALHSSWRSEVAIRRPDGTTRDSDTVPPGNDPHSLRTGCTEQARPVRGAHAARTAPAVSCTLLSAMVGSVSHPLAKMESA